MTMFDAHTLQNLKEFLNSDRRDCIEYERHEVMILPHARELANCVGTLFLMRRAVEDTSAPDVVLLWIPYTLLAIVAPHCLSVRGQQFVKPESRASQSPDRAPPPEWAFTFVLQITQIERLRKSLSRGCRALTLCRAQGLPDISLMFGDGGSSALLVALKNFTTLTLNPQDPDEYILGRRSVDDQRHVDVLNGSASLKGSKSEMNGNGRTGLKVFDAVLRWGVTSSRESPPPMTEHSIVVDTGLRTHVESMLPPIVKSVRRMLQPVTPKDWAACFDSEGRLQADAFHRIRTIAFSGGFDPAVRPMAWAFLLGVYDRASTASDRQRLDAARAEQYRILTQQWQSIFPEQERNFAAFRNSKHAIEKDVRRTDRVHEAFSIEGSERHHQMHRVLMAQLMYDVDLGYCQGMSDILAVVLLLMDSEESAFAMFKTLLHFKMDGNFRDVNVSTQMDDVMTLVRHFVPDLYAHLERLNALTSNLCFHWILLLFKREFGLKHIYPIWDVIFCCPFTSHYEVFMTVALLKHIAGPIVEYRLTLDEILQLINAVVPGRYQPFDVIAITHDLYEHIANYVADLDLNPKRKTKSPPPKNAAPPTGEGVVRTQLRDIIDALRQYEMERRPPSERNSPMTPRRFNGTANPA